MHKKISNSWKVIKLSVSVLWFKNNIFYKIISKFKIVILVSLVKRYKGYITPIVTSYYNLCFFVLLVWQSAFILNQLTED